MGWLRNFVRKNTAPIDKNTAMKWKSRLSAVYAFSAWNLFMLVVFYMLKQENPRTEEDDKYPSRWYAKAMATGDARVYRFSGLTKVGEYEITGTKRPPRGRTREMREAEERGEVLPVPEPQVVRIKEIEMKDREDLNLLVEETSSL